MISGITKGLVFVLFISLIPMVSAQYSSFADTERTVDSVVLFFEPVVRALLGPVDGVGNFPPGEVLFVKLLVFILLIGVIFIAFKRVPQFKDKPNISMLVAVIVSLIAVRYMTVAGLINFIWLPYGVLGVVLSSAIPFIVGFFFVQGFDNSVIRRIFWTAFFVIFAFLGILRWPELTTTGAWYSNLAFAYIFIAIISLILILNDRKIHSLIEFSEIESRLSGDRRIRAADVHSEIENLQRRLTQDISSDARREIEKRIKEKKKVLKSLLRG